MKTALITGGDKGIGFALAQALGQNGWQLMITSRTATNGQQATAALMAAGVTAPMAIVLDLLDPDSIDAAVATLTAQAPPLSLLVNNAGIPGDDADSLNEPLTDLHQTMQVNFFGTVQLTQALLPLLAMQHGRIVNVTIPTTPNPYWHPLAYKASKAAQNVMMETMAMDLKQSKSPVEIFSIHPGPTTTDLNDNTKLPGFHSPKNVAQKMAKLIDDGQSHHGQLVEIYPEITGVGSLTKNVLSGWFHR